MFKNKEKKMYLLGREISHSKSPAFWESYFEEHGLNWEYDLADIMSESQAKAFIESKGYVAINITTPYKQLALKYCDESDDIAKFAGGCNFIENKAGKLYGFNVDGWGCVDFLEKEAKVQLLHACTIVCGSGPTAKSIAFSLCERGAEVIMLSRSPQNVDLSSARDKHIIALSYTQAKHEISYAKIIINATTLGMKKNDGSPIEKQFFNEGHVAFDCIYGHGETCFLKNAREAGAKTFDGGGMLKYQALRCASILFQN